MNKINEKNRKEKKKINIKDYRGPIFQTLKTIVFFLAIIIVIRFYVFQSFTISGTSMEPSFFSKEYLIVDKLTYNFSDPKRGDVIVFRRPEPACNSHINRSYVHQVAIQGPCNNYIKRIIGLPGETVAIRDGKVKINGEIINEDYIPKNIPTLGNQTVVLGEKKYFVLGDNREPNASMDSREWGVLPETHIVGKGFAVLLPPQNARIVR